MRYDYNEIGQLISAVNPNSRTNFTYDTSGRLIEETLISHLTQEGQYQARVQTLSHDYDELGNHTATTLPDGKVINQLYYGSGHLYNQSLHDPSTDEHIEIRHSERNKLHQEISRQQGVLESSYHYDPMGRLTKQQSLNYNSMNEHITIERDYNYDVLGQLTHLTGNSVIGSNKRTQKNANDQQQTFKRNHQYQYDTQGRLTEHKLTDYQNHTGITEVFAFDPASNRVPVSAAVSTDKASQADHSKNEQGRPRELIQNGQRIRYTYDSHGRVLYKTTEPVDQNDKPLKQSTNSLLAHRQALQLQYNANNELEKSLRTQYQGNQVIKTLTEYHYDAFGRRIAKQSEVRQLSNQQGKLTQSSKTQYKHTNMLWDSDLPIQEYSDTHVYTTVYDQGSFKPVARLAWLRADISQPINDEPEDDKGWNSKNKTDVRKGIQVYHYHNDQLGTPNELTNDKGEVVWLADYEAWGNTVKVIYTPVKVNQIQVSQSDLQPIRFQGQHYDKETGLHYNRFRYYDPDMGMFTTRDPIGLMGGDNVFAYAPNPTGWIDPLGLAMGSGADKQHGKDGISSPVISASGALKGAAVIASADLMTPEPTDAFWPKLLLEAAIVGTAAAIGRSESKTDDSPCTSGKCCPPCKPKVGTIGYRPDPKGSAPHNNKIGDVRRAQALGVPATVGYEPAPHFNMSQMNQNPKNCQCFWKSLKVAVPPVVKPGWHGPLPKDFSR